MKLFDMYHTDAVVNVDMWTIPLFGSIRDSYKEKSHADKFMKYVIFNNYPLSPYVKSYFDKDRKAILAKEFLEGIVVDPITLEKAEAEFISLHDSIKAKLLRKLRSSLESLMEDLTNGNVSLKDAIDYGPKVSKTIREIDQLEEDVKMELTNKSRLKGGYKLGVLEESKGIGRA